MVEIPTIADTLQKVKNSKQVYKTYENAINSLSYWKRHLILGVIEEDTGEAIESMIKFWNAQDDEANIPVDQRQPILLFVDSPGGDLAATFTIIDSIALSKTPVYTINIGCAYSGGFFIYITGHKRFTYPHASFLYHEGSTEIGGDAGKFQNFSDFYKEQLTELKEITLKYTKISEELYNKKRRDDWWITANEAIELGVSDEILDYFIY